MKYLSQFLIIMTISLIGEILQRLIPMPIPASVYGIVILFAALCAGVIKLEQVKETGSFLSSIMSILFLAPLVSIVEDWGLIRGDLPAIVLLVLLSTTLTFGIAGRVAQRWMKKEEKQDE